MLSLENILHVVRICLAKGLPRGMEVLPPPLCDWGKEEIFKHMIHFDVSVWDVCFHMLGRWFIEVISSSNTDIGIEHIHTPQFERKGFFSVLN